MRIKYCLGNFLPHFNENISVGLNFLSFILLPYIQSSGSTLMPRFITKTHSLNYLTDRSWVASSVGAGAQDQEIIASERKSLETCKTTLTSFVIKELLLVLLPSCFSHVWLCETPWTAAYQASLSLGFSRQEHWSGLPFPSPMHESGKWKWSHSVVSDS